MARKARATTTDASPLPLTVTLRAPGAWESSQGQAEWYTAYLVIGTTESGTPRLATQMSEVWAWLQQAPPFLWWIPVEDPIDWDHAIAQHGADIAAIERADLGLLEEGVANADPKSDR